MHKSKQFMKSCHLCLVTGRLPHDSAEDLCEIVDQAVNGGVDMVQLREKDLGSGDFAALAKALKERLEPVGIPLIINDRLDIALVSRADGIHVGQDDLSPEEVRRIIGRDKIIGLTINTSAQLILAENEPVDYYGIGAIFPSPTKDTVHIWGVEGLADVRSRTKRHLMAIGGLTNKNVSSVRHAGADSIAVVSSIYGAEDPHHAAADLRSRFLLEES